MARLFRTILKKNPTRRLFQPNGSIRIKWIGPKYFHISDLYHLMLRINPFYLSGLFVFSFIISNVIFAFLFMLQDGSIALSNGGFWDSFFFSVYTMTTIGYGTMYPSTFYGNIIATVEAFYGVMGMALVTGILFARFSKPKARILFSNVIVVNPKLKVPTLMFRLANQRHNRVVEAKIHVVLVTNEEMEDGTSMRRFYDLKLVRSFTPFFALTWTVMHPIDSDSPFYKETSLTLNAKDAELIVTFSGLDEEYSRMIHARKAYNLNDIMWGSQFLDIISGDSDLWQINYDNFHHYKPVD